MTNGRIIPVRKEWIYLTVMSILLMQMLDRTEARYLPTRSLDDRLDKLRELLRDLFESEIQRSTTLECGPQIPNDLRAVERSSSANQQLFRDLGLVPERKRYFKRDIASESMENERK